jgi:ubiquinone/menaquinone biosynthesis C-methylase UbiE
MKSRRFAVILAAMLCLAALPGQPAAAQRAKSPTQTPKRRGLFSPLDLGVLEGADREQWNKPDQIMDALKIGEGDVVADIGAAGGWFTIRLSRRVGPNGRVYAEDVQSEMITAIERRVEREKLTNVRTVLGTTKDSGLPHGLDAILINNVYHELEHPVAILKDAAESLKPKGRIGIVDFSPGAGGPGPDPEQRVSQETVIKGAMAAGLQVISQEPVPPFMFMVVLGKPAPARASK